MDHHTLPWAISTITTAVKFGKKEQPGVGSTNHVVHHS